MNKLLVIDDAREIHALLKVRLNTENVSLLSALDGETGLKMAASEQPDMILLDVSMPAPDGMEVCRRLKADPATMAIPVIFLTGASSTEEKIRGLELGAIDYITKPFDAAELRARVRACLRTRYLMDLLSKKAMIDGLTGLWNRMYFDGRLATEISAQRRSQQALSCIMADIDRFKSVNDTYGHPGGDAVLRAVASVIQQNCRAEDVACRYGGEEFGILLPGADATAAAAIAERMREAIMTLVINHGGKTIKVTCSFGVANLAGSPPPSVVEMADEALYSAKNHGRNRVEVSESSGPAPAPAPLAA